MAVFSLHIVYEAEGCSIWFGGSKICSDLAACGVHLYW